MCALVRNDSNNRRRSIHITILSDLEVLGPSEGRFLQWDLEVYGRLGTACPTLGISEGNLDGFPDITDPVDGESGGDFQLFRAALGKDTFLEA